MIKDSGHRTMFSTGAVRDMGTGKGRMDLLPWHAVMELSRHCEEGAIKYGERNIDKGIPLHSLLDSAARHLAKVMIGQTDEDHLRAACWNLMWALQQRITHPELDDMPPEETDQCSTCLHAMRDDSDFPCHECVHNGTYAADDDMYVPRGDHQNENH